MDLWTCMAAKIGDWVKGIRDLELGSFVITPLKQNNYGLWSMVHGLWTSFI
jgi:hypothetical protein